MKIFLTGGSGFIGSHFINQTHAAGHSIRALRRSPASKSRIPLDQEPEWLDLPLDKLEPEHFDGCQVLVHLASHTPNVPYDTYSACMYWNVSAAVRMFEKAHEAGLDTWIVAGSCFEYGLSGERCEFIPVDAPLEPTLSYPASKAAASVAIASLTRNLKTSLYYGRIFQVYGEGEPEGRLWPSLRKAALAGEDFPMTPGDQVRDFIPVEQVASTFLNACTRTDLTLGQPLIENVGTGNPQSLRQFAEYWWTQWNAIGQLNFGATPYRPNEVMRYVPVVSC